MGKQDPYGMSIRLPEDMVIMLKKLRDEENLPSMATAVKFWVEQQAAERREAELADMKKVIESTRKEIGQLTDAAKKVVDGIVERDRVLRKTCNVIHLILGGDDENSKDMRKLCSKHPEKCPVKDTPGYIPWIIDRIARKSKGKPEGKTRSEAEHVK